MRRVGCLASVPLVGLSRASPCVNCLPSTPVTTLSCLHWSSRRTSTSTSSSSSTGGGLPDTTASVKSMRELGFEHNTPNFNVSNTDLPDDATLGDVQTQPAMNVALENLAGPWLMLTEGLQGELFVESAGTTYFRPSSRLGYGVGHLSVTRTSIGLVAFTLVLEVYTYDNVAENPPLASTTYEMGGIVSVAKAAKSMYETFTLNGQVFRAHSGGSGGPLAALGSGATTLEELSRQSESAGSTAVAFNAAKLTPWDPTTAETWTPSDEVRRGFLEVLPTPVHITSHIERKHSSHSSNFSLEPYYKVGSIENVYYVPNYLSQSEQEQMLAQLRDTPSALKTKLTKRLVQEWGCSMCPVCQKSFVSDGNLPPWTAVFNDVLVHDRIFTPATFPNNVRIHEYEVGEGIAPHCDGPIYVPKVAILSLASTSVLSFYPRRDPYEQPMEHYNDTFRFDGEIAKQVPVMSVVLEPGSLIVFEKDAYCLHPHGISDKPVDDLSPEVSGEVANRRFLSDPNMTSVERRYRVGVTVRNLLPRCNHSPLRAEYQMKRAWQLYHHQAPVGFLPVPQQSQHKSTSSTASTTTTGLPAQPALRGIGSSSTSETSRLPHRREQPPSADTPPSTRPAHDDLLTSSGASSLEAKVDTLLRQQGEIQQSLQQLQQLVAGSVTKQLSYQKDTSTILNELSQTILKLESDLEDVRDAVASESGGNR